MSARAYLITVSLVFIVLVAIAIKKMPKERASYDLGTYQGIDLSVDRFRDQINSMPDVSGVKLDNETLRADVMNFRDRYYANLKGGGLDVVTRSLNRKYSYTNINRIAVMDIIDELAKEGDLFALSQIELRLGRGTKYDVILQEAVDNGEPEAMASLGWFLGTGFNRPRDPERGVAYMQAAADIDAYTGHDFLMQYYYRYEDVQGLCLAAKAAYEDYSIDMFNYDLMYNVKKLHFTQNNCKIFNDKAYSLEEMQFEWLKDINTEESLFFQGKILSNTEKVEEAREIFEKLSKSKDTQVKANALLCLSKYYYYGAGGEKNFERAFEYADQSLKFGSSGRWYTQSASQMMARTWSDELFYMDYAGVPGGGCYNFDKSW